MACSKYCTVEILGQDNLRAISFLANWHQSQIDICYYD